MSDDEIWTCAQTKKCGWSGRHGELMFVLDPRETLRSQIRTTRGCCPRCGQHKKGFKVTKDTKSSLLEGVTK